MKADTGIFGPVAVAGLCVTIGRYVYLFKRLTAVPAVKGDGPFILWLPRRSRSFSSYYRQEQKREVEAWVSELRLGAQNLRL